MITLVFEAIIIEIAETSFLRDPQSIKILEQALDFYFLRLARKALLFCYFYHGGKDRIKLLLRKSFPFLVVRKIASKLSIFAHSLVRSNLRFSSCHHGIKIRPSGSILIPWRKGQDSNLRMFPSLVFKTSAFNHSATFPSPIIPHLGEI